MDLFGYCVLVFCYVVQSFILCMNSLASLCICLFYVFLGGHVILT